MPVNIADLVVHIGADVKDLKTGMQEAEGAVGKTSSAMGGLAKVGMASVLGGAGLLVTGLGGAVKVAADFESQMQGIQAVSGATGAEMKTLSDKALQIGKDTSFSASEAAGALQELVKAGVSIPDIMNGAADATVSLAAASGVSIPEAATLAANAMNAFKLSAKDMPQIADLIAGSANASAIDVGQFGQSLQSVGAVANAVGFSFKDVAVAISELGNAGITGSDAGTSLKTMFMNLSPQTKEATAQMKSLGIITYDAQKMMESMRAHGLDPTGMSVDEMNGALRKYIDTTIASSKMTEKQQKEFKESVLGAGQMSNAFFDANGKVKSLADVSQILQDSLKGLTQEQRLNALSTMFGTDAIRAASILADGGADGYNKLAQAMGAVSANDVATTRMKGLSGTLEAFKGTVETLLIMIGQRALPVATAFLSGLTTGLNNLMPLVDRFGPSVAAALGNFATMVQGGLTAALPSLQQFGSFLISNVLPAVIQFAGYFRNELVPAISDFAARAGAVIGPVMSAIGGAISDALPQLQRFAQWFQADALPAIEAFAGGVRMFINDQVIPAVERIYHDTLPQLQQAWATISKEILPTIQAWADHMKVIFGAISGFIRDHGEQIKNILSGVWTVISATIGNTLNIIVNLVSAVLNVFQGDWRGAWQNVQNIVTGVWDTIKTLAGVWWSAFKAIFEAGWTAIKEKAGELWGQIHTTVTDKWDALKKHVDDTKDTLVAAVLWPFEQARDKIGSIMDGFKSALAVPWNAAAAGIEGFIGGIGRAIEWVAGKLHVDLSFGQGPSIPRFAKGGVAPGGPIIAGENGEELLMPPAGTRVFNARETIEIFKAANKREPEGAPLGVPGGLGRGAGPFSAIVGGVKDLAGDVAGAVRSFIGKGVEAVANEALSAVGATLDLGGLGDTFKGLGGGIFTTLKDAFVQGVKGLFGDVKDALPPEAVGGVPSNYPGGNAIIDTALGTPGQYMWCEKFVGDVFQRLGLPYYRAGTAEEHAHMQPLNPGTGPMGAVVFYPWQGVGHVNISGGDGSTFGTVPEGTGWRGPGAFGTPYGWTTNPRFNGGPITEPVLGRGLRSGETYSFGEYGNEYVIPAGGLKGGGGLSIGTITVTVTPPAGADPHAYGVAVGDGILDAVRRSGRVV